MATKTISIDVDAYERLKSVRKPAESFSQTIKRVVRKPADLEAWFSAMERSAMSRRALAAVTERVARRARPSRRRPR
jgi:predicted CopG family antitoxin